MFEINGTSITLTRGDSLYSTVKMKNPGGTDYQPQNGDSVRFALKRFYSDAEPVLIKQIPLDTLVLHLEPGDTKELEFGSYVYDIELTKANGDVDTFISTAEFILDREVY